MSDNVSSLAGRTVLVTGANRGIGLALVDEALRRGAGHVYAATRRPFERSDERVTPLHIDVTDEALIQRAAEQVAALDILINNAGVSVFDDLTDRGALERHLAVNLYGTQAVTQAFLPQLEKSAGAIVNVLSLAALASVPVIPAYSVSKAAALSLTQGMRALLAARGVRVHAVLAGPVDTDMTRDLDVPKTTSAAVARSIFDAVSNGDEDIFPDPMSASFAHVWPSSPAKIMEAQNAALLAQTA